jgi:hypothetical protein
VEEPPPDWVSPDPSSILEEDMGYPSGSSGTGEPLLEEPVELPVPERPVPDVIINGIIWNSDRPQAIINGRIVDIGDTIFEIQITGIQKTGIEGLFDGRVVTLKP